MASIQTDGFTTSYGITINFQPWWTMGFRLTCLHLYEELGGEVAHGDMELLMDGSEAALNAIRDQKDGTLTISDEWGQSLTIPVSIYWISGNDNNYVSMKFLCLPKLNFVSVDNTVTWESPIKDVISSLYPGKIDIRDGCEPDIQKDPKYYQNKESDHSLCTRLCYSYKKDSIFSFGVEGLLLKDTKGNKSSWGKVEPHLEIWLDSATVTQRSRFSENAMRHPVYKHPINIWEDTEGELAIKDYTQYESLNLHVLGKYRDRYYMHSDYEQLENNLTYNRDYQMSQYVHSISIINRDIPKYRIGDVLIYNNVQKKATELSWDQKNYLVKSNEIFLAVDSTDYVDEYGEKFGWTSELVCLDENAGDSILGSTSDPVIKE